jgi:hypothetical protein
MYPAGQCLPVAIAAKHKWRNHIPPNVIFAITSRLARNRKSSGAVIKDALSQLNDIAERSPSIL